VILNGSGPVGLPWVAGRAPIDCAAAMLASLGQAVVLRKTKHRGIAVVGADFLLNLIMILRLDRLAFCLSIASEARRSAMPLACVTVPSTARPLRFFMTAWSI
jgi:hypothetical protein